MTYLLKHKDRRSKSYKKISYIISFATILIVAFFVFNSFFSSLFTTVFTPISGILNKTGENISSGFKIFEPKSTLVAKIEELENKNRELESRLFDYEITLNENISLKEKALISPSSYITATPILMPPKTPFDTIIINKGSQDGISQGAIVLYSERVAIGYIEEVNMKSSIVKLYSSSGIKTNSVFLNDGTFVELEGRGGGNFIFEAPLGFEIKEGDIFVLPGDELRAIAEVGAVEREDSSTFITVLLKSPLPITGKSTLLIEKI